MPGGRRHAQDWAAAIVLGVADEECLRGTADFDALTAAVGTVGGLAPIWVHCSVFHRWIASITVVRDSSTLSARPLSSSNTAAAFRTSSRLSVVWSSTADIRMVSGISRLLAISNAPNKPARAAVAGTIWTVMFRRIDIVSRYSNCSTIIGAVPTIRQSTDSSTSTVRW